VRYYDGSGFGLTPYIPYAWQEKGNILSAGIFSASGYY